MEALAEAPAGTLALAALAVAEALAADLQADLPADIQGLLLLEEAILGEDEDLWDRHRRRPLGIPEQEELWAYLL